MKTTYKTDKELAEINLWPKGFYDFEIVDAKDEISSKGNEMIHVQLRCYDDYGSSKFIHDYLLDSMAKKINHAAKAIGLFDKYKAGELIAFDFMGKTGKVELGIQIDKEGKYPDKNTVLDYVHDEDSKKPEKPKSIDEVLQDQVPF